MGSTCWLLVLMLFVAGAQTVAGADAAALDEALWANRLPSDAEKTEFILETMRGGGIPGLQTVVVKKWQSRLAA